MVHAPQNRGSGATRVGEVLSHGDNTLSTLFRQAKALARVDSLLAGCTSPELFAKFQVAALKQDCLVLITPNAAWATRLRMQSQMLLSLLRSSGYAQLNRIDVRVAPLVLPEQKQAMQKTHSAAAKRALDLMSSLSKKIDGNAEKQETK